MLFQQDMQLPIDMEILPQAEHLDQQDPNAISARIDQLLQSREEAFKETETNIPIAQKKQKETYNRKHRPPVLELESKVLLENTAQKQQKGATWGRGDVIQPSVISSWVKWGSTNTGWQTNAHHVKKL